MLEMKSLILVLGRKHKQQEENVNTDGGGEKSQQLTNEDEASIELTKVSYVLID